MFRIALPLFLLFPLSMSAAQDGDVDFGSLLKEMHDMAQLARMPQLHYTTYQFSSYDRRATSPEEVWYTNSDGFGREPIPGFMKVLEEPGEDGVGLYLVGEVHGPGP